MNKELKEQLDSNIPANAVSQRSQSGQTLSYLETWYVIDRLNQVIGTDNWSWQIVKMDAIPGDKMSFICHGVLIVDFGGGKFSQKTGIGYGSDKGKYNPGEMASKEAESDAFKRAAMKFGRSLGLALYDKTQEYVDEEIVVKPVKTEAATTQAVKEAQKHEIKAPTQAAAETTKDAVPTSSSGNTQQGNTSTGALNTGKIPRQTVKSYFSVLRAKNVINQLDFAVQYLGSDKTKAEKLDAVNLGKAIDQKIESLTESEISATLGKIRETFKQQLSLN